MANLVAVRDTPRREDELVVIPAKAGVKVWTGSLVVVDAGYIAPGRQAANLYAVGRAESTVDNLLGVNGAVSVTVRRGIFKWDNDATDAVTQAQVGQDCFVSDDQTVKKTGGAGFSRAGKILNVESDGVWVETLGYQSAS